MKPVVRRAALASWLDARPLAASRHTGSCLLKDVRFSAAGVRGWLQTRGIRCESLPSAFAVKASCPFLPLINSRTVKNDRSHGPRGGLLALQPAPAAEPAQVSILWATCHRVRAEVPGVNYAPSRHQGNRPGLALDAPVLSRHWWQAGGAWAGSWARRPDSAESPSRGSGQPAGTAPPEPRTSIHLRRGSWEACHGAHLCSGSSTPLGPRTAHWNFFIVQQQGTV